ncbi:MAG: electron transfer flavoprotein subunit beta/FixA family protein [Planifilum sp.]|jgi:electron transfer flavoprotein beta subunit
MLHIVVCVKQVPDSREIRIHPKTNTLIRQGVPAIANFYDMHGLEEALRIKDQHGARITVITMGPPPAEKTLKECISLGADEAILVTDRKFAGADTLATSYVLAKAIQKAAEEFGPVDLVFCGKQTLDGDTGQVGPGIACRLDLEQLTYVEKVVRLDVEKRRITVHRHLEDGVEVVETRLPALITALQEMNKVRRASLPGMIRAARYKPIVWTVKDFSDIDVSKIGLKGSPTIVAKSWVPEQKPVDGEILEDTPPEEAARQLVDKLWETELPEKLGWDAEREEVAP